MMSKKIILIVGEPVTSGERKAREIAQELKKELEPIWEVIEIRIDKKHLLIATNQIFQRKSKRESCLAFKAKQIPSKNSYYN
ncbi:MAG: hypothetical protein EU536_00655 [Promethearchaeota archaeon]|nr:MAG: hypothetical protein EU536_00655 [Candidatus Lokiarchaeota archaeon]